MSEKNEDKIVSLFDWVRKNYADSTYDEATNSIRLSNGDMEHVAEVRRNRDGKIEFTYDRKGLAGVTDNTKLFDSETNISSLQSTIKQYMTTDEMNEDMLEKNNPARVQKQMSEAKSDIEEDDNQDSFVIPSKTRGNLAELRMELEKREDVYVEYNRSVISDERVKLVITKDKTPEMVDHHRLSGKWVFIEARNTSDDGKVLLKVKRGGISGDFEKRKEFSLEVGPQLLMKQITHILRLR